MSADGQFAAHEAQRRRRPRENAVRTRLHGQQATAVNGQPHICSDGGADTPPLWARVRLGGAALESLGRITYVIARSCAPEPAARAFSRAAGEIVADAIDRGGGTWDLWQDPGELICQVVLGAPDPASGPRHRPGSSAGPTTGPHPWLPYSATHRIDAYRTPNMMAVRMSIDSP
ncbi:hypothetical protein [Pseudonocardia acidicola]|uniref:Uncharacterized protein n=1 Tax=Pseudonocardia acidicola TaxID=2724939 RepID=A0ABX1S7K1_9PSEU|nr:hypothetical protein [Pseudonocardia acidicola]NMH96787.1 hypothetical protein [Pseudonocardia acidicola]